MSPEWGMGVWRVDVRIRDLVGAVVCIGGRGEEFPTLD